MRICICANHVSRTYDVIEDATRSESMSDFENAITRSGFILHPENKYWHNLWFRGHLPDSLDIQYQFWKIVWCQKSKSFSGIFKIHVVYIIPSVWLQIWKLDGKLCNPLIILTTLNIALYEWVAPGASSKAKTREAIKQTFQRTPLLVNQCSQQR